MIKPTNMDLPLDTLSHKSKMDILEAENAKLPQVECPLVHRFTDGMYIREIHMPAGIIVTSRTHKTQHPFVISKGVVEVVKEDGSRELLKAPHTGITNVGTRRVLLIHEDTIWSTFHITEKTDPVEIENEITCMENELLPKDFRQGYLGGKNDLLLT
jgi:hypothetical protein